MSVLTAPPPVDSSHVTSGATLRVLHVTEYVKGGTATYVNTLLEQQQADPRLAGVRLLAADSHREHLHLTDEFTATYAYARRRPRGWLAMARAFGRELAAFRPDVVHLHGTFAGATIRLRRLIGRPFARQRPAIVYCAHGWSFLQTCGASKLAAYRLAERQLASLSDRIICISEDERREALAAGLPADRCVVVHNALPVDAPPPQPLDLPRDAVAAIAAAREAGAPVWLFVGRYDEQKGLDALLPAFAGESFTPDDEALAPGVLLCAGEQIVGGQSMAFGPRAVSLGWQSGGQITALLELCDGLVVPSRWEGFGLVAAEAMRAGRAVVATAVGGLPEVVADGVTGRLCPDAAAMPAALRSLPADTLAAMGRAGRDRFAEHFTAPRQHAAIWSVYADALRSRCGGEFPPQ